MTDCKHEIRIMTKEEREASDAEARLHMEAVDSLHKRFAEEIGLTFGVSYKIYREFKVARDSWEWTVHTKFIGRGVRFDVEIPAGLVKDDHALDILIAQLPEQMQAWTERNVHMNDPKSVGRGWFAIDRNSDEGIAGGAKIVVEPPVN
jgi:hypothetical protein